MTEVDAETYGKLHQIKHVLERWEISGINRKLQLKPRKWEERLPRGEGAEDEENEGAATATATVSTTKGAFSSSGGEGKVAGAEGEAAKATAKAGVKGKSEKASQLLLILKWGGELTNLGQRQAIELGNSFRTIMYPDSGTGGLLRLHRWVILCARVGSHFRVCFFLEGNFDVCVFTYCSLAFDVCVGVGYFRSHASLWTSPRFFSCGL